jgi:polyisoprenoid-binding protein YceI
MAKHIVSILVLVSVLVSLLAIGSTAPAQNNPSNPCGSKGQTFYVNDPMKRNTITFRSEAPLEDIVGTSNVITGKIVFDPTDADKGGMAKLVVASNSFTTGIPLRDEHLAGGPWLDAENHPQITLDIKKVNKVETVSQSDMAATYSMDLSGDLTIRGKTNPVSFVARVTYLKESEMTQKKMAGDLLAVRAEFEVSLSAYEISGPPGMGLMGTKVSDMIEVSVSLIGSNAPPETAD